MRLAIFAAGSRGDIQPCIVLGCGLQAAGVSVRLAAPQNFAAMAHEHGLPFHALRGDVQAIMAGETGREFMASGGNPLRSIIAMRKMLGPVALQMAEDALDACREADALLSLGVFAPFARTFAETCGIPLLFLEPTPLLPTVAFPAAGWPVQRSLGGRLNRLSGHAMLRVIWEWYRPSVNVFRERHGLDPLKARDFYRTLIASPLLGAYSPAVIPPPRDWPDSVHIPGYLFQNQPADWQPPAALARFLEAGEPPVYVGFGSMGGRDPERLAGIVLEALALIGRRGVLATGWGGLRALEIPQNVHVLDAAPHSWLFPRMSAVVHHGGAGTTAEGLRAGRPTVIVPFIVDQRFWGRRVRVLGVGPEPVPARALTAERLAAAINAAIGDPAVRRRAESLGQTIRDEGGTGNAVAFVRNYLGA